MKRERGSILIMFLWTLILLGLFATSVANRTRLATKIQGFEHRNVEMNYDFLSAVNLARYFVGLDDNAGVDYTEDSWYGTPDSFSGMSYAERFDLEIGDEDGKININKAPARFLREFFKLLKSEGVELKTRPEQLAASIVAWRGKTAAFGSSTLGHAHKRAPFESLEELFLIQHIKPEEVDLIKPYLTVFGLSNQSPMRLNVNTADPLVLQGLISSFTGDRLSKDRFFKNLEKFRVGTSEKEEGGARQALQAEDLAITQLLEKLQLVPSTQMSLLVKQFLKYVTVDSRVFSVKVRSLLPKKESFVLHAVIGPSAYRPTHTGKQRKAETARSGYLLDVLAWREAFEPLLEKVETIVVEEVIEADPIPVDVGGLPVP